MSIDPVASHRGRGVPPARRRSHAGTLLLAAALLLAEGLPAAADDLVPQAHYAIVDLGPLPTRVIDDKPGLGPDGAAALWRVVGGSALRTQFVGLDDVAVDLGTLPGHANTIATDINARSTIVGMAQGASDLRDTQAFVWQDGKLSALPTLGGQHAAARAINRAGHIAGSAQTVSGELQAVRWEDGRALALAGPVGCGFSEAFAISEDDAVVGDADVARNGKRHAVVWNSDGAHDLGTLAGGGVSSARAINASHEVVGFSDQVTDELHAVMWLRGSSALDLGSLGQWPAVALDINDAGQVVGRSSATKGPPQAFLWEKGHMTNLNALVAPGTGWRLETAYRINALGEILGHGYLGGESRAFLLRPVRDSR